MSEITVICFSRNDEKYEQKRVSLSIQSLLEQSCTTHSILFYDCSAIGREFILPSDPRLIIKHMPSAIDKEWRPAHMRNLGATETDSEFIVHINTDNIFSSNFLQILLDILKNCDKLVLCARRQTTWEQFHSINTVLDATILAPKIALHNQDTCGDCQGFRRKTFLTLGGYYGKIGQDGKAVKGSWKHEAYGEDTQMLSTCDGKNMAKEWISDRKDLFMLHLAHNHRKNARLHCFDMYGHKEPDTPEDCL